MSSHNGNMLTSFDLNLIPLGSYDLLIGMDWLAKYKTKFDSFSKSIEWLNHNGKRMMLHKKSKHVTVQ